MRDLTEENGYAPTSSTPLCELIPFVLEQETSKVNSEIGGLLIFDGRTHMCKALVIIVRFMGYLLMLLSKSLTGEELAMQIVTVISTELSVSPQLVSAEMRDRVSVDSVAMRTIVWCYL